MNTRKIRELNKKIKENKNLTDENRGKTSFVERRIGQKDRLKVHTYLADDRRCGIADRRKRTLPASQHYLRDGVREIWTFESDDTVIE